MESLALATPRGVSAPDTEPSSGEFDIVIKAAKRHRVHSDPFGDAIQKPAFKVSMRVKNVAASVMLAVAGEVVLKVVGEYQLALDFKELAVVEAFPSGDGQLAVSFG